MTTGERPIVEYFALGGTIASVPESGRRGAVPTLSAEQIVASVPGLDAVAAVRPHQFAQLPASRIRMGDVLRLRDRLAAAVLAGAVGAVVTQGTDTIDETAFLLDLVWERPEPVVVTGAMRNPSLPGSDGPANLLAAVAVAASAPARGLGVLVVLNDEIHAARFVRKTHTSSTATFASPWLGPLGWVSEGRPVIALRPSGRFSLELAAGTVVPPVALLRQVLDDDCRLLAAVGPLGYAGLVVEAFGGGHVSDIALPALRALTDADIPVVLASRTGAGEVLVDSYRFEGSEITLIELGLIRAGVLDGPRARLLLALCLAAGRDRAGIAEAFRAVGQTTGPVIREDGAT